jgi:thioredoxin 1
MLVVMQELRTGFPKQLEVQFINVHENPDALNAHGVSVIPAQIFYTNDGRELFRHTGFFSTQDIVAKWRELGYDLQPEPVAAGAASP